MPRITMHWTYLSLVLSLLFSFMGSPQARASNTWSRAKGAVHSLHDTAVALRRRIDDVDPHGYAHRIACELEASVCDLKEAIACDAPRQRIEYGMQEIGMLNQQLIRAVASHCDLRNSRRVLAELDRFQDRYCTLERELRKCFSRLPVCPPGRPNFPVPYPPIGRAPIQSYPPSRGHSSLHPTFREQIERENARRYGQPNHDRNYDEQFESPDSTFDRSLQPSIRISTPSSRSGNSIKREVLDMILTQAMR